MNKILEVKNVSVSFGDCLVLENICFDLFEKEFLLVLGPNGAGKSVLIKSLLGLVQHEGSIEYNDGLKKKIAYVPQYVDFDQNTPLTCGEIIKSVIGKSDEGKADKVLEAVGLLEQKNKIYHILSGGQKRRLLIAKALVIDPLLLIMDEPLAGIDMVGENDFHSLLQKMKIEMGLTIIMVSHDFLMVEKVADKVLCVNKKMMCFGGSGTWNQQKLEDTFGKQMHLHDHGEKS